MSLSVFIKESAEVSDSANWVKKELKSCKYFSLDAIEGYTVDDNDGVIMMMERAKVDYDEMLCLSSQEVIREINEKDGEPGSLQRKINLARVFGIDLLYALYSEASRHHVWLYRFRHSGEGSLEEEFNDFSSFGIWLSNHRTKTISKGFGHENVISHDTSHFSDLPGFDQTLRNNKTPWLGNLDAFVSDKEGNPIALIEFQNTSKSPKDHCNNFFFLSGADFNRVNSWEIARVHSGLPFFIIVWSKEQTGYRIKRLDCCTFLKGESGLSNNIQACVSSESAVERVANNRSSYSFTKRDNGISRADHTPPLSIEDKTFPSIYYKYNELHEENSSFIESFLPKLGICPQCGGKLVPRNGRYGPFIGCSSYPNCHYIVKTNV